MSSDEKLMDMLTGYAAAHRHPFNIWVHMIGIPTIMLGVLIPLTWVNFDVGGVTVNLAHGVMLGCFMFYMTLDRLFAIVFLIFALLIAELARRIGTLPIAVSGMIAAFAFVGGYVAQFLGHAVEKSMPVLAKHPIQANLAAPLFTVVEVFKVLGLRDDLFNAVQKKIAISRTENDGS